MRFFVKLLLIAGLAVFALSNYRLLSFEKGWSIVYVNGNNFSAEYFINLDIYKIEYYKQTKPKGEYVYKVFISTNKDNYLLDAKQKDISALDTLSLLSTNIRPEKISPIPFYVEIVLGIIILFIPAKHKEKRK